MHVRDWVQKAANEIANEVRHGDANEETVYDIIEKHCPFKPNVAYIPVGDDRPPEPSADKNPGQ